MSFSSSILTVKVAKTNIDSISVIDYLNFIFKFLFTFSCCLINFLILISHNNSNIYCFIHFIINIIFKIWIYFQDSMYFISCNFFFINYETAIGKYKPYKKLYIIFFSHLFDLLFKCSTIC